MRSNAPRIAITAAIAMAAAYLASLAVSRLGGGIEWTYGAGLLGFAVTVLWLDSL